MFKIYNEDCLMQLDKLEENSIDSIVTDPPYGLTSIVKRFGKENSAPAQYGKDGSFSRLSKGFMGKEWDGSGIEYNVEMWQKCLKVLKPGGYLLAFGGSRTFHRIAVAIEDAGFEIRDTIMWLYGSGFPKSMNIGLAIDKKNGVESKVVGTQTVPDIRGDAFGTMNEKQGGSYKNITRDIKQAQNEWQGWGTALKPSFEPIIVARKPFKGSLVDNVIEYGVGGINIDECRIAFYDNEPDSRVGKQDIQKGASKNPFATGISDYDNTTYKANGRFPANTILTYDETDFDEVCGGFPNTNGDKRHNTVVRAENSTSYGGKTGYVNTRNEFNDSGSASRYFYCAKASKKDRDEGLENFVEKQVRVLNATNPELENKDDVSKRFITVKRNIHPTVKPTELMQYLIRLATPNGGTVLDPFMGSGSTGKAVMYENKERNKNYNFIGIEKDKEYCEIAKARISYAEKQIIKEQEENETDQISLF